jgi:Flp pilus assembly CpaE family ATPase
VLDLGILEPLSLGLLEDISEIVVVAGEDLPSLWEAARLLKRLTQLGVAAENVRFVVNQKRRRRGVAVAELEKAMWFPIFASITAAWEEQEDLLAEGRFVDEKSQIGKDVAKFVAKLLGKEVPDQPSGFRLSRLVGR